MAEPRVRMDPAGLVLKPPRPAALLASETTVADHFVLAHHGIARCEEDGWTLTVDGLVGHELELSLADLRQCEPHEATVVLECAGNPEDPDKPTRFVAMLGGAACCSAICSCARASRPRRAPYGCAASTAAPMQASPTTPTSRTSRSRPP